MDRRQRKFLRRAVGAVGALLLLGGCEFVDQTMLPAATGEAYATSQGGVPLGTTTFGPPGVTNFASTGTVVGKRVAELRDDLVDVQGELTDQNNRLQQLRAQARTSASYYHGLVAAINSRLQVGTTPGNPELVQQWSEAQAELERVNQSISAMNGILNETSATSARTGVLLESIVATFALRGAVDADHAQLAVLQDETSKTAVVIDRLLNEVTEDIARATSYVAQERSNLTALSVAIDNGEFMGPALSTLVSGQPVPGPAGGGATLVGSRQALVVIRFDRANIDYQAILYSAVSQALERRPNAAFDVVAVAPAAGNAQLNASRARRYAEEVFRSLINMGLPPDRVSLAATSSAQVQVDEVHVYVR